MRVFNVGDPIKIKRSDGRVHWALIRKIYHELSKVMVGWFEEPEVKRKDISFEDVERLNPDITFLQQPIKPDETKIPVIQRVLRKWDAHGQIVKHPAIDSMSSISNEPSTETSKSLSDEADSKGEQSDDELNNDPAFEAFDEEKAALAQARKEIGNTLVTSAHSYVVVNKKQLEAAGNNEKKMFKAVVRWGQTSKLLPFNRWQLLRSFHKFSDDDYTMILVNEWTDDNLPERVRNREEASILDEFFIESHKDSFTLHKSISSGQGTETHNEQMKALVTEEQVQLMRERLLEVLTARDYVPSTGHYHCNHEKCNFTSTHKDYVVDHILIEHSDANGLKPTYICPKCNKVFKTNNLRAAHHNSVHNKPPPCPVCKTQYSTRANAKRHLMNDHKLSEKQAHLAAGMKPKKSYKS